MSEVPERIWMDGDITVGDGYWTRCFEDRKPCSEPAIEYVRADCIEELEAKLAKAVTRLQHIAANKTTGELTVIEWDTYDMFTLLDTCISEARTTLAELKGETNE